MNYFLFTLVLSLLTAAAVCLRQRLPVDVLKDLKQDPQDLQKPHTKNKIYDFNLLKSSAKEISFLRILSDKQLQAEEKIMLSFILLSAAFAFTAALLLGKTNILVTLLFIIAGACLGYILSQVRLRSKEEFFKKQIVFYLPVVMERVVMAIQSGLDIVPALKIIDQIESQVNSANQESKADPVTLLLRKIVNLAEAGLSFQAAVQEITDLIDCHALKHALIHLALAQKEGGELFYPLRELSDATQLYFQESVEEDIARMPIKATMPLLITFAGLLVTFMTGPLVQIVNVSANPTFISGATQNTKQSYNK